jgi:Winged helix-turn-helix DNA-binding
MNRVENRKTIISKWLQNPKRPVHFIAKELNFPRTTVRSVIDRYLETLTVDQKPQSRPKYGPHDRNLDSKILRTIKRNPCMSTRDIAKKTGTTQPMVQRGKKRGGLKTYRKRKVPKVTEKQKATIKTRSRKLYDYLGKQNGALVLDDETSVKADFQALPGIQFYTKLKGESLGDLETIKMEKFGPKYLVWQAISSTGARSRIFVTTGTINREIYINECIKKRLLPFLRAHEGSTLFWPDLASAHYAKDTLKFMEKNGINFVSKDMNPPNVPQCRPIERYWALIRAKLLKKGAVAKNQRDFCRKWNAASKEISNATVKRLFARVRAKVGHEYQK